MENAILLVFCIFIKLCNAFSLLTLQQMTVPVLTTNEVAPIKLAADDLSKNMRCGVSGFQQHSDDNLTFIHWNMVNVSKRYKSDKTVWYLEDTICPIESPTSQTSVSL